MKILNCLGWSPTIVALAGIAVWSCVPSGRTKATHAATVPVRFELAAAGQDDEIWLSRAFPTLSLLNTSAAKDRPGGLLLRPGDLIFGRNAFFEYRAGDGRVLRFRDKQDEPLGVVNGVTVAVSVGKQPDGVAWLQQASAAELAGVRTLSLAGPLDDAARVALLRLATSNPHVSLLVDNSAGTNSDEKPAAAFHASLVWILETFSPGAIILPGGFGKSPDLSRALQRLSRLEKLVISGDISPADLQVLPSLSTLTHLCLFDWIPQETGPLPAGMRPLRQFMTLTIDEKAADWDPVSVLFPALTPELEELSLIGGRPFDLGALARFPRLRTLAIPASFDGEHPVELRALANLPQLEWVSLFGHVSGQQLAQLVEARPRLKVLELLQEEKPPEGEVPASLVPLKGLRELESLSLLGKFAQMETIRELKSLRFVGIDNKTFDGSPELVAGIQHALPDALVVPVAPVCLGSGWLLLLAPLVVCLRWFRVRLAGRTAAGIDHA